MHSVTGLTGEVGELAGAIERYAYYGQDFDHTNIIEELGDCLWYIAEACDALGVDLTHVMQRNIDKLQNKFSGRYKDAGFNVEAAKEENRNRAAERALVQQPTPLPQPTQDEPPVAESTAPVGLQPLKENGRQLDYGVPADEYDTLRRFAHVHDGNADEILVALPTSKQGKPGVYLWCTYADAPDLWFDFYAKRWKELSMAGKFHQSYRAYCKFAGYVNENGTLDQVYDPYAQPVPEPGTTPTTDPGIEHPTEYLNDRVPPTTHQQAPTQQVQQRQQQIDNRIDRVKRLTE